MQERFNAALHPVFLTALCRWLTGVHPIKRRNTVAKYWELLKPSEKAMSVTESLPFLSCTQAASIFLRKIYSPGGIPVAFLNQTLKRGTEIRQKSARCEIVRGSSTRSWMSCRQRLSRT